MLGLAFHPRYSSSGFFYVNYTSQSGNTVIARYHVSTNPNIADPDSGTILLMEPQPFGNHNGGQLRFGRDGFLYLSFGDGGSGGDPLNSGQRLNTILGKLLRIDVDTGTPYAIPASNPFVNTPDARGEIWVYGQRNPWRFSFDRQTGDLFIADVGQNAWEEIDFQAAGSHGENYGWRLMEGLHCFDPLTACNPGSLTLPVLEYPHSLGCSVTGGFRYSGTLLAAHVGTYFFSDFCTGRVWGATLNASGVWRATQLLDTNLNIATFGEDAGGEIYLSHHASDGQLYRLVSAASASPILTVTKTGNGAGRITSSPAALHCGTMYGVQLPSGTVVRLTATPDSGSTFGAWSGDADCTDGTVTLSANQSCTAEFIMPFTDDSIVAGTTTVKAVHISELRTRIDAHRANAGLSPFPWTTTLTAGSTLVQAVHITDLRTALNQVYSAVGRPLPSYIDPELALGDVIKAAHISEFRSAVLTLE